MVPLVVYFAGSLFGETGCQVMLERIFFNPGQLIFSLSSKKCLNCYNMWGHVWENIIFLLYIVSTFGCFGKIPSIFWISNEEPCSIWLISIPLNFLVLKRSIPPQYLWSSLQGLSFIKQQIVQMRMIHILHRIFQFRCQRDQPRKPNFCAGATSKKRQSGKSLPAMFWSKKDEHLERTSFLWVTRPFQMCSHSPG